MEETPRKGKGGRPPTGRLFPHKVFGYVNDEDWELLHRLAAKMNGSGKPRGMAGVVRAAIKALAREEARLPEPPPPRLDRRETDR
jgi:hypothetical protein